MRKNVWIPFVLMVLTIPIFLNAQVIGYYWSSGETNACSPCIVLGGVYHNHHVKYHKQSYQYGTEFKIKHVRDKKYRDSRITMKADKSNFEIYQYIQGRKQKKIVYYAQDEEHNDMLIIPTNHLIAPVYKEYYKIAGPIKYPPSLEIQNIIFSKSNNQAERRPDILYGGESGGVSFDIENNGRGIATGIIVEVTENGNLYERTFFLYIESGKKKTVSIPISAPLSTEDTAYQYAISVTEVNGFDASSASIRVPVLEVATPEFEFQSVSIDDDQKGESWGNGDGVINPGEAIEGIIYLKNTGNGSATDVNITVSKGSKVRGFFLTENDYATIPKVKQGQVFSIPFQFMINKKVKSKTELSMKINISEESGLFGETFTATVKVDDVVTIKKAF